MVKRGFLVFLNWSRKSSFSGEKYLILIDQRVSCCTTILFLPPHNPISTVDFQCNINAHYFTVLLIEIVA